MQEAVRLYLSIDEARKWMGSRKHYMLLVAFLLLGVSVSLGGLVLGGDGQMPRLWYVALFGTYAPFYLNDISLAADAGMFGRRARRFGEKAWITTRVLAPVVSYPCLIFLFYYLAVITGLPLVVTVLVSVAFAIASPILTVRSLVRRSRGGGVRDGA